MHQRRGPARHVPLPLDVHAPATARAAVRELSDDLGLHRAPDDLLLVVSELVTNAVRYALPPVVLDLTVAESTVTVSVADGSCTLEPRPPDRAAKPGGGDERGRGLPLVARLSLAYGVDRQRDGKCVWATLRLP